MITVKETTLKDVLEIGVESFEDHRGEYVETYNRKLYIENGIPVEFIQDDYSTSTKHVLRGIHGDAETWKLISCPFGKIYLVVVDCNENSENFGKWQSFVLSSTNKRQVLIPPMYGNGHLILSDVAIFNYKQSSYYAPDKQFSYTWNDPQLGIWWPIHHPILSRRDELGKYV